MHFWVLERQCGMNFDFDNALDSFRGTISTFDFSNFVSKDTVYRKAHHVLANVLFGKIVQDMKVDFDMTTRQKLVFECLKAAHAQDFLLAIYPSMEYRAILRYRLMISLFSKDEVCPVCHKACFLDTFGEHAAHCRELPDFKYRHNLIRDVLFGIFKLVGISVKKEAPVNFSTDPQKGDRHFVQRISWCMDW
ncbi:hypothetical protein QL285_005484 [Trifolium repens]|nr:hypothetical protein QL285_005484 [Trifolium repens]